MKFVQNIDKPQIMINFLLINTENIGLSFKTQVKSIQILAELHKKKL